MLPTQLRFFLDESCCKQRTDIREYFLAIVSSQMLNESKYYAQASESRDTLTRVLNQVAELDPEFVLQVAYYVRNKMYLRSVSNFILAFASIHKKTKPFCDKYFCPTLLIPGDLIEVCQYVQVIRAHDTNTKTEIIKNVRQKLNFPKILQKQIKKKLRQYSVYQLGKQCSDASRKKNLKIYKQTLDPSLQLKEREKKYKKKMIQNDGQDAQLAKQQEIVKKIYKGKRMQRTHQRKVNITGDEKTNLFDTSFIYLKDIIQLSHASQPQFLVASVLGKKYPATVEEFKNRFPDEDFTKFQPELAGTRMKIPIPITWDRELSQGVLSKTEIWTKLLLQNNVPYLALLRNLRNILKAGVSDEAHLKAINKIKNPGQVQNSKTFPLQYFSALREINSFNKKDQMQDEQRPRRKRQQKQMEVENAENLKQTEEDNIQIDQQLINSYSEAIEEAMKLAVEKNLETIPGVTYIFVDVSGSMSAQISGGKKYGSVNQCMDCGFVLGHLIRMKCENSQFYLFAEPKIPKISKAYVKVEFGNKTLLQGIQHCQKEAQKLSGGSEWIGQTIQEVLLEPKIRADNIVVFSDMMITQGFCESGNSFAKVIKDYVNKINPDAKFFFMDISGYGKQTTFGDDLKSKNCFLINGMSDNVLKYIAEAGKISQVEDVVLFSKQLDKLMQIE